MRLMTPVCALTIVVSACEDAQPPEVTTPIPDQTVHVGETVDVDPNSHFTDPEGASLTFKTTSANPAVSVSVSRVITVGGVSVGESQVTVTATDPDAMTTQATFKATVPNRPPQAVGEAPDVALPAGQSGEQDIRALFQEPDGEPLVYGALSSDEAVAVLSVEPGTSIAALRAVFPGETTGVLAAVDPHGESASHEFRITVPNSPPELIAEIPDATMDRETSINIDLSDHFVEPDGQELSYEASSTDAELVAASLNADILTLTSSEGTGSAGVTVTATDGELSASDMFRVTVDSSTSTWRENFDSAGALDDWDLDTPDGSSVEISDGAMLLNLPTEDYSHVSASAAKVANVDANWVASTYMGLTDDSSIEICSDFIVHTGDGTYPSWLFEIDHWDESFLIYVRYSRDNWWHAIWEGYFEDYTDDIPGVGDYYDLALSMSSDTLTVMYNDTVRIARFHPKDDGDDWPGDGDVPDGATGVALGGSNCFGLGTVYVDFVEISEGM